VKSMLTLHVLVCLFFSKYSLQTCAGLQWYSLLVTAALRYDEVVAHPVFSHHQPIAGQALCNSHAASDGF